MSIPNFQDFMQPVLKCFLDEKNHTTRDVYNKIIQENHFAFTDEEQQMKLQNGQTVIYNRIAWAISYLFNAKFLERPQRATYTITQRGKEALKKNDTINVSYLAKYDEFTFINNSKNESSEDANMNGVNENLNEHLTPDERIDKIVSENKILLANALLDKIKNVDPQFFEKLVVDLMLALGYGDFKNSGTTTSYVKDGGIDGIIKEDKLGLDKIFLQAKRYKDTTVGSPDIQRFVGAISAQNGRKGVFITTSTFSQEALNCAKNPNFSIVLIDGKELSKLMIEHNLGIRVKHTYETKEIAGDYFDE